MADFFETVKRGLEKGVASVGAKSREILETSELRGQIRTLEEEKRAKLEELGNIVCLALSRGGLDEARLREKAQAIAALDTAIKAKEEQIKAIQIKTQEAMGKLGPRVVGRCTCGADLLEGAKFCGGCGAKAAQLVNTFGDVAAPTDQLCSHCRTPIAAGARFCGSCGSLV